MSNAELEAMTETAIESTVETTADSQGESLAAEPSGEAVSQDNTTGDTKTEQSAEATPASEEYSPNEKALYAKSKAEKEKRQAAEKRSRELELEIARLSGANQATTKPDTEEVDFWTDPNKATETALTQFEQAQLTKRMNVSEAVARAELPDYDKYADHFIDSVAPSNPAIKEMLYAAPDPARFAYVMGKKAMEQAEASTRYSEIEAAGGLDAYIAKIKEETLASAGKKPIDVPPDLSKTPSRGGDPDTQEVADGNAGLQQLFGR